MERLSSVGERRQHPRVTVKLALDYWKAPSDDPMGGLVANISESGLRIDSIHSIQIGAELKIKVYVPKEEYIFSSIEGSGKIVWRTFRLEGDWEGYRHGLHLTEMSLDDRERLKQFLTYQQQGGPFNNQEGMEFAASHR